jgi:hypothetical protein
MRPADGSTHSRLPSAVWAQPAGRRQKASAPVRSSGAVISQPTASLCRFPPVAAVVDRAGSPAASVGTDRRLAADDGVHRKLKGADPGLDSLSSLGRSVGPSPQ